MIAAKQRVGTSGLAWIVTRGDLGRIAVTPFQETSYKYDQQLRE